MGVVPNAERTMSTTPAARKYNPATNTLIDSCTTLPLADEVSNYPRYEFYGVLKNVKGELFLTIQVGKVKPLGKGLPWTNKDSVLDYKLPNRPLIK